jgi:hypothetical protein
MKLFEKQKKIHDKNKKNRWFCYFPLNWQMHQSRLLAMDFNTGTIKVSIN